MRWTSKRGQAAGAAVLLAIIAGLLIMFVILIPPQERAELLGDEEETSTDDVSDGILEEVLLEESPGRLDYLAQKEIEHPLPVVNIYTRTESKVIAEKNLAYAKRAVFSEETSVFKFKIDDPENTENVLLSFSVEEIKGRLIISLNGEEIFDSEITSKNVDPIKLAKNMLQSENELVFSVSSPGVAFWVSNEVSLEDIRIVADVTNLDLQSSKSIFLVSETEKENLDKVILKFEPTCNFIGTGRLVIEVNNREIYNALPDCDLEIVPIEFSADVLHQGENEIVFYTEKGTYLLSHVVIVSEMEELVYPVYYFEISHEQYEEILDEELRARLKLSFVDIITEKHGELVINGDTHPFDTKELSYVADLSREVVKGSNSLMIRPKKTLDVREIKVELVK